MYANYHKCCFLYYIELYYKRRVKIETTTQLDNSNDVKNIDYRWKERSQQRAGGRDGRREPRSDWAAKWIVEIRMSLEACVYCISERVTK